jgi:hypothetical protein
MRLILTRTTLPARVTNAEKEKTERVINTVEQL